MKWRICVLFSSILVDIYIINGIYAHQDLLYHKGCDAESEDCKLHCLFNTSAENFNATWTLNGTLVDSSLVKNIHIHSIYSSKLHINIDADSEGNYTCIGYDDETNHTMVHSFPIYGNQSIPKIVNISYDIAGQLACNVTFTCVIQAAPSPTVEWLKIDLIAQKSSIMSGYDNVTTEIPSMPNYYMASLTVTNYVKTDVANYTCLAFNDVGIDVSNMIFPHVSPGFPIINEQSVTFKPGDVVHLNCTSSGGFPAPNITWDYKGEQAYLSQRFTPVDNGVSVAYLDIYTSWNTDNAKVSCNVQDTAVQTDSMKSCDVSLYLTNVPYLVTSMNCNVDDFEKTGRCSLSCEVYSPDIVSVQWLYRFDANQDPFPMTNISYPPRPFFNGPYRNFLDLTSSDYRTGLYECKFLSASGNITNTFHINGTKQIGDSLGTRCTDNSANNCGTWNSVCYGSRAICHCPHEYPIQSDEFHPRSSACLPEAPPGSLCLNSRQCDAAELNYECYRQFISQQYGFCQCIKPYIRTYIYETKKYQCIAKATYQSPCRYDAQCQLSDLFLECDDDEQQCECVDGYYYSSSYNYCQYGSDSSYLGLSETAAIIITIAILIVIIFVVTLIFIRTNSRNSQRRNRARTRRAASSPNVPLQPFTLSNNIWSFDQSVLPPYTTTEIAPPPSYHEAQRCETPPPSFDSIIGVKPSDELEESQCGADADSQQSTSNGIFHIYESDSTCTAFLNPAYEDDC